MRVNPSLIQQTINKAKQIKLEPEKLKEKIKEDDRSPFITLEQQSNLLARLLDATEDQATATRALERIIKGNDLTSVNYLIKGVNATRSVCRIQLRNSSGETTGYATGFLVAPGVLMTNHHVISGSEDARWALAEFDYELDISGKEKASSTFAVLADPLPIANKQLDFCLVQIESKSIQGQNRSLLDYGWLPLNPEPGKAVVGEYLTIIQHPRGERKQVCVRENKLLRYDVSGNTLWYATDTVAGSSGSPAFNNSWEVVALHHSGVPKTDENGNWLVVDNKPYDPSMDESHIAWIANEGIRISSILAYLAGKFADHPLAKAVLARPLPSVWSVDEIVQNRLGGYSGLQHSEFVNGELRVTVPIQISVRVEEDNACADRISRTLEDATPIPVSTKPIALSHIDGGAIEKVDIDQSNYEKRTGYDPDFLKSDALRVPLPVPKETLKNEVLTFRFNGATISELKYWNYSVVMHKSKRLAVFAAVNVDAYKRPTGVGCSGDRWYFDSRIEKAQQIGSEFYRDQLEFEANRSQNPFDRGHLTRRLDAQWGANKVIAKRNGDDTFHWTNCVPQYWQLNQGRKLWLGLEDYVIDTFAKDTGKAYVISGPVFDAPLSQKGPAGVVQPNLKGERHKDPTFGGVAIPKLFFKVVACEGENGSLQAAAFIMSQEDFLQRIDELRGMPPLQDEILTPAEARLYQVGIKDLEELTNLEFGL